MRRVIAMILAGVVALELSGGAAAAASKVKVVASLPDLKALTEAVGGDLVDVDSLARGTQNPHDIEVRPSLMLKLRRADLVVRNGVGGDPWVEPLLVGSQNAQIFPGAPGYVDASVGVRILAPSGPVDRSRGDVHPEGNPHYTMDPANAAQVTQNIVDGLKRVAPQSGAALRRATARLPGSARERPGPLAEDNGSLSGGTRCHLPRNLQLFSQPLRPEVRGRDRGSARHPAVCHPPGQPHPADEGSRRQGRGDRPMVRSQDGRSRRARQRRPGADLTVGGGRGEGGRHVHAADRLQRQRRSPAP